MKPLRDCCPSPLNSHALHNCSKEADGAPPSLCDGADTTRLLPGRLAEPAATPQLMPGVGRQRARDGARDLRRARLRAEGGADGLDPGVGVGPKNSGVVPLLIHAVDLVIGKHQTSRRVEAGREHGHRREPLWRGHVLEPRASPREHAACGKREDPVALDREVIDPGAREDGGQDRTVPHTCCVEVRSPAPDRLIRGAPTRKPGTDGQLGKVKAPVYGDGRR